MGEEEAKKEYWKVWDWEKEKWVPLSEKFPIKDDEMEADERD